MEVMDPPFRIDICWNYKKIFRETKKHAKSSATETLAVWQPILSNAGSTLNFHRHSSRSLRSPQSVSSNSSIDAIFSRPVDSVELEKQYFFGYLGSKYDVNPNLNIPTIIIKYGSDESAFRPPKNFQVARFEQLKRKHSQTGKEINVFRYWLHIVAPKGYVALGSVVIEKFVEEIPSKVVESDLKFYLERKEPKYYKEYGLDSIVCLKQDYVTGHSHFVDALAQSKLKNFSVYRQQPLLLSGVYKLVEMPFIIACNFTEAERKESEFLKEHSSEREGFHISYPFLSMVCNFFFVLFV